jgi:hypothetical protein
LIALRGIYVYPLDVSMGMGHIGMVTNKECAVDMFIFLAYIGGVQGCPDSWGVWKTLFWPYYVVRDAVQRFTEGAV